MLSTKSWRAADHGLGAPRLLALAGALLALAAGAHAQPATTARLTLDAKASANAPTYPAELFGVSWNWLDNGGGLVEHGELVRDRSFRNQADAAKRAWIESPNRDGGGKIERADGAGDPRPWAGYGYAGSMRLSQRSQGYTCLSQRAVGIVEAGVEYELHVSARRMAGGPGLAAFFADQAFMPIEELDKLAAVASADWADYRFALKPKKTLAGPFLRLCMVNTGELEVDEVRLRRAGAEPRVRKDAAQRIVELGVRSLRWPTGSDADHFDWRQSIGALRVRGENPSAFAVYETASLGLHEFLDFCEAMRIVPLLTVNILLPPQSNADLVEYVLGSAQTPMGGLRARNGRSAPWDVRHFELGNEPVELYRADFGQSDTARGYAKLAAATGAAMKSKARALGTTIELQAVAELTFTLADWIGLVPMLKRWNPVVLDRAGPLRAIADRYKGNFYSAFTWAEEPRELWEEVMGGGATIAASVAKLEGEFGPLAPFWLTEYGIMIQKNRLLLGSDILLERAKDFQAGLSAADILLTALQGGFGGAYLFNLSQWGTWGIIGDPVDLRLRPSGLAFSMIAPLSGTKRMPVRLEGGRTVLLTKGKGNNPAKTRYPTLTAVAGVSDDAIHVVILNRAWDAREQVAVELGGIAPRSAEIFRLGPAAPEAGNEKVPAGLAISRRTATADEARSIEVPPRSLTRLVYRLR